MKKYFILFTLLLSVSGSLIAQWAPKVSPIKTPWTDLMDKNNPLPEYPRPQMVRTDWKNLNGYWEYKVGAVNDAVPHNQTLGKQIVVPFAPESTLSGIIQHNERIWYRKLITIPSNWSGKRILLHFGAIDWESEVFVNGSSMGIHKGGYDEFAYDITDKIIGTGNQEIIVRVYDPTRSYGQPRGKQTDNPGGIMYTCATGIWQTVWIEPVSAQNITNLKLVPDIDNNRLKITVNTTNAGGLTVTAVAKDGSSVVGTVSGAANTELFINIPNAKLWSPDSPFLYDLAVELKNGSATADAITSYFGMRKISIDKSTSTPKVYLNNKAIFMMGPLDQGYWPDGIYTAPTDEALRFDLEQEKAHGFNMVRKHLKVEPQRWYYWADKLGLLVWQDMPSANTYDAPSGMAVDQPQFNMELTRMINTHINSPSIIMWVLFNEFQGQFDATGRCIYAASLDPSRLINQGSGDLIGNSGQIYDGHSYPQPICPVSNTLAVVCGEYGGIGFNVPNHQWGAASNPYDNAQSAGELLRTYSDYVYELIDYKTNHGLSGAVYTEITDVEGEINGLLTYDRIVKGDAAAFKAINQKVINQDVTSKIEILPISNNTVQQSWKYVTTAPPSNWNTSSFNDASWTSAKGGFGAATPNAYIGTPWTSSDIWIRKTFNIGNLSAYELQKLMLTVFYDEGCEIYINGILAAKKNEHVINYTHMPINEAAKNALVLNGVNTIAIHCHQTVGGQYIDAGISSLILSGDAPGFGATFYKNCTYGEPSASLSVGDYSLSTLIEKGILNDDISSLKVLDGYKIIAYANDNFGGNSITITANNDCLADNGWNDLISSLKIQPNGVTGMNGTYTLQNRNSSLFMDVADNGNPADGTNITQWPSNGGTNQQFTFTHLGDGAYKIINVKTGKSIDVSGGNTDNFANIQQSSYAGSNNQKFILIATDNGCYKLKALHSGRIIEVGNASLANDANINQFDDNNQTCGQWKLLPTGVTTDIHANSLNSIISIYPNPVSGLLNIVSDKKIVTVTILNIGGQELANNQNTMIDVSNLQAGYYLLKIQLEDGFVMERFVKQ